MGTDARTFRIEAEHPRRVLDAVLRLSPPPHAKVIIFVSEGLVGRLRELAERLREAFPAQTFLIVPSVGVISEEGESERTSAATGMLLPKGVEFLASESGGRSFGEALEALLKKRPGASACLLARGDAVSDGWLEAVRGSRVARSHELFGGGTLPGTDLVLVSERGIESALVAALVMSGGLVGRTMTSGATRLLGPLGKVTRAEGAKLLEIDHVPALVVLEQCARELGEHPLVLLAVGLGEDPLSPAGRNLAAKPITGVDPLAGALLLADDIVPGARVAFAVRDSHTAHTDLSTKLRTLGRSFSGGAPHFGVYVNCAGRGTGLYGVPGVDARLIHSQFPNMPFVGLTSTFELSRFDGQIVHQVYSGVLGVFSSPS